MIVLSDKCKECNSICYTTRFLKNFQNWTSGNDNIDKYIQSTQSSAHNSMEKALEWIPYEKFHDVEYIAEDKYIASWIDGYMIDWNNKTQSWKRKSQNMSVELVRLNNPENITFEFMDKV
jgi:hypothetical protein